MRTTRRSTKFAALAVGLSLVAAACGDDDDDATTDHTAPPRHRRHRGATETTEAPETTDGHRRTRRRAPTAPRRRDGDAAMTRHLRPRPTTPCGTTAAPSRPPTSSARCDAILNTPGSLEHHRLRPDHLGRGRAPRDKEVVVEFSDDLRPVQDLFSQACSKARESTTAPTSRRPSTVASRTPVNEWKIDSWSAEQIVLVPNEAYTGPARPTGVDSVVIVPGRGRRDAAEGRHGRLHLPAGLHRHRPGAGRPERRRSRPRSAASSRASTSSRLRRPVRRSDVYREAFSKSIDTDAVYDQIYAPFAQGVPLLDCGPIASRPYCDPVFDRHATTPRVRRRS